jgi:hypothetical protein
MIAPIRLWGEHPIGKDPVQRALLTETTVSERTYAMKSKMIFCIAVLFLISLGLLASGSSRGDEQDKVSATSPKESPSENDQMISAHA